VHAHTGVFTSLNTNCSPSVSSIELSKQLRDFLLRELAEGEVRLTLMEQLEDTSTSKKRMPTVSDIAKAVNLPEDKLLNIYLFGSQLFGTANPDSGSLQDD
jgi:hypothetical protein